MNALELVGRATVMGFAGPALIDAWAFALRRSFGVSSLDYRLLGRWIGHFRSWRFIHRRIANAPAIRGERLVGWLAHYSIGVVFAAALLLVVDERWTGSPTLLPALLVGIATVGAPWFVMQPAFGAGIAGRNNPHPWPGRLRNIGTHTVYGLGLYLSALALSGA